MADTLEKDQLLTDIRKKATQWAAMRLISFIEDLDNHLFNQESQADSNEEQTRLYQTRTAVKATHAGMREQFAQHLDAAFRAFAKNQPTVYDDVKAVDDADNFTIVDNDEFEQKLAISTMVNKTNANYSEALHALNQRLSALTAGVKVGEKNNPLSPAVFAQSIQAAIQEGTLDNRSVILVYKFFESTFMRDLGKLYDQLNQLCIEKGVLPNLSYSVSKTESSTKPEETPYTESQQSVEQQTALMSALQQIFKQRPRPPQTGPMLSTEQLIGLLHQLQKASAKRLQNGLIESENPLQQYKSLQQTVAEQTRNSTHASADTIDIVGLLFQNTLDNPRLPNSAKTLISYLHTPYLRIALTDPDFFNSPAHPARQLLNSLIAAGERWATPKKQRKGDVLHQMESVINRVVDDASSDLRFLTELVFEFNRFLRQHARRVQAAEKRAKQAAEGEHKLHQIRLKVKKFIEHKTLGCPLPSPIETLLFGPWANYLSYVLLRFGSKSSQWRAGAKTVLTITEYLRPNDHEYQQPLGNEVGEELEKSIRQGFEVVGYDAVEGQKLITALHKCHELATTEPPQPESKKPSLVERNKDIDEIVVDLNPQLDAAEKELLDKVDYGSWFLFGVTTSSPQLLKLAWYNSTSLRFMFVNRHGQQAETRKGHQLIEELRSGQIKILGQSEDKPFFESALEKIVKDLTEEQSRKNFVS